jgi:hypothetical protein
MDDEVKGDGNSVNFSFRMHDPRLGRFFAIDPLANDFCFNSPYAFSQNRVLDAIELEGAEAKIIINSAFYNEKVTSAINNNDGAELERLLIRALESKMPDGSAAATFVPDVNGKTGYSVSNSEGVNLIYKSSELILKSEKIFTTSISKKQNATKSSETKLPEIPISSEDKQKNEKETNTTPLSTPSGSYSIERAVNELNKNSLSGSNSACAKYVRLAIEAGGIQVGHEGERGSAYMYKDILPDIGFSEISNKDYKPQKGDVAVFASIPRHKHGHIAMYNGSQWVSDFKQKSFWVATSYKTANNYKLFRINQNEKH